MAFLTTNARSTSECQQKASREYSVHMVQSFGPSLLLQQMPPPSVEKIDSTIDNAVTEVIPSKNEPGYSASPLTTTPH